MAQRLKLESFEQLPAEEEMVELDPVAFEEAKLASFETGYQAGWDDAVAAQNAETARLHADLGRNLQALSFTYHEARQHMLDAIEPLLTEICATILPKMARGAIPGLVADQLMPLAEARTLTPITIVAHPEALTQIEEILRRCDSLPLVYTSEPSLDTGQVLLKFAEGETRIDLSGALARISQTLATCFHAPAEESHND
ncbi:flagellar biosynthesis protein [Thioclava sp. BHET1]|nr:flagellar biosynthesis protein [Thioclava sp. BHET1]